MKRYDAHLHTKYSHCSNNELEKVLAAAKKTGLTGLAVTDHNTIEGALRLKKLNQDKNFEVVIGEEVSTDLGHVLVYYVKKAIKPGSVESVIKEARKQKALCVLAHPYNLVSEKIGKLVGYKNYRKTIADETKIKLFDAVEGFNARCLLARENKSAQRLAQKYKKPMTGGSDGHFLGEVGHGWTEFEEKFNLRQAILNSKTKIGGKRTNFLTGRLKSTFRLLTHKK